MKANHVRLPLLAASLLCSAAVAALSEFGIEGMGVLSTADDETHATVSPDGQRIVWSSADRRGGPGGGDLWQAVRRDGRWVDPELLSVDTPAAESDPNFSADGRWLYFASDRAGGIGGSDIYRAPVAADGSVGEAINLGVGVNSRGDERSPTPSNDGARLMLSSNGRSGGGGYDLYVAYWNGTAFNQTRPVPGADTSADELDGAWLGNGRALLFTRAPSRGSSATRLWLAQCNGTVYADAQPLVLSFNTGSGKTRSPVVDLSKPSELLFSGAAKSPKAGRHDIYRMRVPAATGMLGCS